ncbi:hypothetical protein A4A49_33772 [Nicotiana attenuata]|uniref:Uncharacterized protein n=1 Tax=Nicotiana attenuata TaxID=49451 RepID=A0A1J6L228_NICAT|nr:hypothetical protein A4A49_33772 [Nicotiana attenuata]
MPYSSFHLFDSLHWISSSVPKRRDRGVQTCFILLLPISASILFRLIFSHQSPLVFYYMSYQMSMKKLCPYRIELLLLVRVFNTCNHHN